MKKKKSTDHHYSMSDKKTGYSTFEKYRNLIIESL